MLRVQGTLDGQPSALWWDGETFSGDLPALDEVEIAAARYAGRTIPADSDKPVPADGSPRAALALMLHVLGGDSEVEGYEPPPEGKAALYGADNPAWRGGGSSRPGDKEWAEILDGLPERNLYAALEDVPPGPMSGYLGPDGSVAAALANMQHQVIVQDEAGQIGDKPIFRLVGIANDGGFMVDITGDPTPAQRRCLVDAVEAWGAGTFAVGNSIRPASGGGGTHAATNRLEASRILAAVQFDAAKAALFGADNPAWRGGRSRDLDRPVRVGDDLDLAVKLLSEGRRVELDQPDQVSTLLDKLAAKVAEAKKKGEKAKDIDLCDVSVEGTNLFCADEETEILTRRGWLRYGQAQPGDEALTLDHKTGLSEWQPVEAVHVFPSEMRLMLRLESKAHSSLTTLDHRWPVVREGARRWTTSGRLAWGDALTTAVPCANLPTDAKYRDELVALVAWAWTEGTQRPDFRIYQSHRRNPANCGAIRAELTSLYGPAHDGDQRARKATGVPLWRETRNDATGMTTFHLNKAAAIPILAVMDDRKVVDPSFVASLTEAQLRLFIDISIAADGHRGGTTDYFSQRVEERVRTFEMACALIGRRTSTTCSPERRPGRTAGLKQWNVSVARKPRVTRPVALAAAAGIAPRESVVAHEGIVWCPQTPNGTWLARRRGTVYYTGNCTESKGIPRIEMPQLSGRPLEGSKADALPKNEKGEVELTGRFLDHLAAKGYAKQEDDVQVSHLRATQNELNGGKVSGMYRFIAGGGELPVSRIVVSRDNYILDGHHRWAAEVGHEWLDGKAGDVTMPVTKVDIDIGTLLHEANTFSAEWGIPQAAVKRRGLQ